MPKGEGEQSSQIERDPVQDKFVNIFELKDKEISLLRQRIEKWDGLVRIFIHPYYYTLGKKETYINDEVTKKFALIDTGIRKMLSLPTEKTLPIIIFEEWSKIKKLKKRLSKKLFNTAYIVPTYIGTSEPKILGQDRTFRSDLKSNKEISWNGIIENLTMLGVKKILIGGMYFKSLKSAEGIEFYECVGEAVEYLDKSFKVDMSNLTLPEGRESFQKRQNK